MHLCVLSSSPLYLFSPSIFLSIFLSCSLSHNKISIMQTEVSSSFSSTSPCRHALLLPPLLFFSPSLPPTNALSSPLSSLSLSLSLSVIYPLTSCTCVHAPMRGRQCSSSLLHFSLSRALLCTCMCAHKGEEDTPSYPPLCSLFPSLTFLPLPSSLFCFLPSLSKSLYDTIPNCQSS